MKPKKNIIIVDESDDSDNEQISKSAKKEIKKCEWVNQSGGPCPWKSLGPDKLYCKAHEKYEGVYTKDDIPNMARCSVCKNLWMEDGINKTCCRNERKTMRKKNKEKNLDNIIKCKGLTQEGTFCPNKANENDEYCGKHQKYKLWKQTIDSGKNMCKNWVRGCFEIIPNDKKSCSGCRKKEQDKENANNFKKKNKANEFNKVNEETKMCFECNKIVTTDKFVSNRCVNCYNIIRKHEDNRKKQDPLIRHLSDYKSRAKDKNILWELTDEEAINYFNSKCEYCNILNNYNGIDRINSNKDYTKDNVVSCCSICNIMKSTYSTQEFINIVSYILSINLMTDTLIDLNSKKLFKCGENAKYYRFISESKSRDINNEISEQIYNLTISQPCTYCKNNFTEGCRGIDRINSEIGYVLGNITPCCYTCNLLKNTLNKDDFMKHLKRIYDFKVKNIITNEKSLKEKILELCKSVKPFQHEKFSHEHEYYEKLIYSQTNINEIKKIKIELEFVEDKKQKDIWNYFRRYVSSLKTQKDSKLIGRQIHILIKDKVTCKYLGIMSFSSDIYNLESRDKLIGWNVNIKNTNLKNIMNMSTCVSLQPFGFNFNGGKLLASLAFSKEIFKHFYKKYDDYLLGITTTSLYGKSIQYDRLKNLKYVGLTKGNSSYKVSSEVTNLCLDFLKKEYGYNYKKSKKFIILQKTFDKLNLPKEDILTDIPKGVYFGLTFTNSKKILNQENQNLDLINKKELKSAQQIFDWWVERWAKQRFEHLNKSNKIKKDIEIFNKV